MKVFLSSTAQDLDAHRKVAEETIHQLSQQIVRWNTSVLYPERRQKNVNVWPVKAMLSYASLPTGTALVSRALRLKQLTTPVKRFSCGLLRTIIAGATKEENLLADPNVFSDPAKADEVRQRVQALFDFKAWLQRHLLSTDLQHLMTGPKGGGRPHQPRQGPRGSQVPQDRISIARLPVTGAELFGREAELQLLDEAWENPNTNVVCFIAWGGVGKTSLINHWLKRRMARDNYRGAVQVLGWSFFSQGTRKRAASADLFIDWGLRWFGDAYPNAGSPWDKVNA